MIYLMHGLNEKILEYVSDFEPNSTLTFDDGLRSVYKYMPELQKISQEKKFKIIILINPKIVLMSTAQSFLKNNNIYEFIECFNAHKILKLKNNASFFMDLEDLHEIKNRYENIMIGLHGWDHFLWSNVKEHSISIFRKDILNQYDFYKNHRNLFPKHSLYFAWPYNEEYSLYKNFFKKIFKDEKILIQFLGKERKSGEWNYYEKIKYKKK